MSLFDAADAKPNLRLSTIFSATTTTEQDELEASETTPKKRHATKASARPRRGNGAQKYRFSCEPCRKRKIRCTREEFCSSCVRRGKKCVWDACSMVNEAAPTPRKVSTPSTHQQKGRISLKVKLNVPKVDEEQATPTPTNTTPSTPPPAETPPLELQPSFVQQQLQPQVHLQSSETELETFYSNDPRHLFSLPASHDPSHANLQHTTSLNSGPMQPHYFSPSPAPSFASYTPTLSDLDLPAYHYQPACEQYREQHDNRPLMDTSAHNDPPHHTPFSLYAQPQLSFLNAQNHLSRSSFLSDQFPHSNNLHAYYASHIHSPKQHQHPHHAHDTLFDPSPFSSPSVGRELQPSPKINVGHSASGSGNAWDGWGVTRAFGTGAGHDTWSSDGAQGLPSSPMSGWKKAR